MGSGTSRRPVLSPQAEVADYVALGRLYGDRPTGDELMGPDVADDARSLITHLRRMSGLHWGELARVFGVDRRALHYWATGRNPSPENLRRLQWVVQWIERYDSGTAELTREALISAAPGEASALGRLVAEMETTDVGPPGGSGSGRRGRRSPTPHPGGQTLRHQVYRPEDLAGSSSADGPVEGRPVGSVGLPEPE